MRPSRPRTKLDVKCCLQNGLGGVEAISVRGIQRRRIDDAEERFGLELDFVDESRLIGIFTERLLKESYRAPLP